MPKTRLDMLGVSALTLALGLWGITRENSMWRDEAATWEAVHRTTPQIGHMLGQIDIVHGLYYLFMHGLFQAFGDSLYTLRLPSVLATTCTAAAIVLLGSRLADRCAGLAAGLAFTLLPAVQQYAQEGRPYALVMLCIALSSHLLVASVANPGAGRWAAYGAATLAAALLNWFSLLVLFAHAVTIAFTRPPRSTVRRWALAACAVVLCASPLILASQAQAAQIAWIPPVSTSTLLSLSLTVLAGLVCAWIIPSGPAGRATHGCQPTLISLALPLLGLPPLLLLAVSAGHPVYQTRYILFSHLGLALLIGAACRGLAERLSAPPQRTVAAVLTLASVGLLPVQMSLRSASSRIDDVLFTAHAVATIREPGDAVLYIPAARRDTALVSPTAFAGARDVALIQGPDTSGTLYGKEGSPRQIAAAMLTAHRVIVVTDDNASAPTTARDREKQRILAKHFVHCSQSSGHGRKVTVYRRRP